MHLQNKPITIAGQEIKPGTQQVISLPMASLYTQTQSTIPVHIFHGKKAGPKVFVIGTIHGDEINSVEIIRRLLSYKALKKLQGTLILIPVANVYGFVLHSRYLPDRRDLNRSFPGSKSGSLAARLANMLVEEVVSKCSYGIDLHTGAYGRCNMPQLRVNLDTPGAEDLARVFGVPVILDAKLRDGSLRQAASELGIPLLVYEGGEALRFNEICIQVGVIGVLNVLKTLGMISTSKKSKKFGNFTPVIARSNRWIRAESSGLVQPLVELSATVKKNDQLALIHDPFVINASTPVLAPFDGIVIGNTNLPLVNEGDALYHIASVEDLGDVTAHIEEIRAEFFDS